MVDLPKYIDTPVEAIDAVSTRVHEGGISANSAFTHRNQASPLTPHYACEGLLTLRLTSVSQRLSARTRLRTLPTVSTTSSSWLTFLPTMSRVSRPALGPIWARELSMLRCRTYVTFLISTDFSSGHRSTRSSLQSSVCQNG